MESIINPTESSSLISYNQPPSEAISKLTKFKAATVQLLVSQPDPALFKKPKPITDSDTALANRRTDFSTASRRTGNYEPQFGPQYRFNDSKKMATGPVWELDRSIVINGVDYAKWPQQLSTEQVTAYYESGRATVLNTVPGNPAVQQDSRHTTPSLELLLPENATKDSLEAFFKIHPERVVEDALAQAFGTEGARYLRYQLDQLSTENEQAQQWKEVSEMLSNQDTCSFPYKPSRNSPEEGKGHDIIFEMMFIQDKEKPPAQRSPTNERAYAWRKKMGNFLESVGIDGDLACKVRSIIRYRGFNAMHQSVSEGSVQYFLTATQVLQLFKALRSFVTGQLSASKE